MKKLILVLAIVLFSFSSCDKNEGFAGGHNHINASGVERDYKIIVIDECEYILYDAYQGYTGFGLLAHKGNCKYCEQRAKNR